MGVGSFDPQKLLHSPLPPNKHIIEVYALSLLCKLSLKTHPPPLTSNRLAALSHSKPVLTGIWCVFALSLKTRQALLCYFPPLPTPSSALQQYSFHINVSTATRSSGGHTQLNNSAPLDTKLALDLLLLQCRQHP